MTTIIPINKIYYMEVGVLDNSGDFVTGLTITYEIRKSSDNTLFDNGTLVEQSGGAYVSSVTFTEEEQYRILYFTPTGTENGAEDILTEEADLTDINQILEEVLDKVCKILGLSQSNYKLSDQVYNSDNCLTSATITIYPTATDLANDTNAIASYSVTAVYDSNGRLIDYRVVEN